MKRIRIHRKKFKRFLKIFRLCMLAVFLISAFFLGRTLLGYYKNHSRYEEAALKMVTLITPTPGPAITPEPAELTPTPGPTPPITVDFEALKDESTHVKGWIYSPDTPINYPVMQYKNNDYYLTHAYDGSNDKGGAIFLDCRTTDSMIDQHLIIYGHHMKNRSMFGSLMQYQKQDYYTSHPVLYLITPEKSYEIQVFAARTTDSDPELFLTWFASEGARENYYGRARAQSTIQTEVGYNKEAQLVSLVTCSYYDGYEDAKFQVHGWLVPLGTTQGAN